MSLPDQNTKLVNRSVRRAAEHGPDLAGDLYVFGPNGADGAYRSTLNTEYHITPTNFLSELKSANPGGSQVAGYLLPAPELESASTSAHTVVMPIREISHLSSRASHYSHRALHSGGPDENLGYRSIDDTYRSKPGLVDETVLESMGTRECIKFRNRIFGRHPELHHVLVKSYMRIARESSYVEANCNLRALDKRLSREDLRLSMDDDEIKDFCRAKALQCERIGAKRDTATAAKRIARLLSTYGITFPVKGGELEPAIRRCEDQLWWRRQVRTIQAREYEQICREMGLVHKRGETYASSVNVRKRRLQTVRNRQLLAELTATNQFGQEFTLQELSALSVSNPEIRRCELMVRLAGFEKLAKALGLSAEFYTITCPSRFHSVHTDGRKNKNYEGATAREANDYLCRVGSRIRAKLHRDGIEVFGFRVVEPHHDGCPHWHWVLFMRPEQAGKCRQIMRHYALQDSPDEPGAQKYRFKAEAIDPTKGSATGYVAKYISKNINGQGIDCDLYGNDAVEAAERVQTWAAVNGIRQFQQIGGPPVTVWRELRRLGAGQSGLVEQARLAADSADWASFVELMGGPYCGRDQAIKIATWQAIDEETGEVLDPVLNRYGEVAKHKIYGIWCEGVRVVTRFYRWVIGLPKKAAEGATAFRGAVAPPWSTVNNCTEWSHESQLGCGYTRFHCTYIPSDEDTIALSRG